MRNTVSVLALLVLSAGVARGEVKTKAIEYRHGEQTLIGYLAWDDAVKGDRPGVMVVHEWWGLNDYARSRAEQLAALGYVAFAADMYGDGKVTEHPETAREWAGQVRMNVDAWRERAMAGLDVLRKQPGVDAERLAAIGYCFGGGTVLQMAYAGADLDGVVSFHGALPVPTEEQAKQIKAAVLICHGASDPFIPESTAAEVRKQLTAADVDWEMIYYGGAVHSFTSPGADKVGLPGLKYHAKADQRSWDDMQEFFAEIFAGSQP